MNSSAIAARIPTPLKQDAISRAHALGIPLSRFITRALERFIYEEKSIELDISPRKARAIIKDLDDAERGIGVSGPFSTTEEIRAHLDSLKRKPAKKTAHAH